MNRTTFLAILIMTMGIFGCPGPNPDPCDDVVCGDHGNCVNGACECHDGWQSDLCDEQNLCFDVECGNNGNCVNGECACDTNYYGEDCSIFFDCTDSLACALVCPEDSGRLTVTGPVLTDNYVEYDVGTFDRCTYLFIRELIARQVPDPDEGRVLDQACGMTIQAVDANLPRNEDGTWNDVEPSKDVKIHFANHRARVLRHVEDGGLGHFDYIDVTVVETGSIGEVDQFSDFLLLDTDPVCTASAPTNTTIREVTIDFAGTLDEGDSSVFFLSFSAEEDGTPLTLTALDSHSFTATLSGGSHTIFAIVEDPNGSMDTVELTVYVDLCSDVICELWETCRELDGECVGNDPCMPNPCSVDDIDYGTCNSDTGEPVCECFDAYAGNLCDLCDVANGYEGIFPDCQLNLCFGVDCPDDNDECNGTEECNPVDGQCIHVDPVTCPNDGNLCNGDEVCEPSDGSCIHVDPLNCDNGLACDGTETCDPVTGCTNPDPVDCDHGNCQEPSGTCSCDTGWNPDTNCSDCLAGYDLVVDQCVEYLCYQVNCPDDGDECNGTEACDPADGTCQHFDAIDCGTQLCRPADGACVDCLEDGHCDNINVCDGTETCNAGSCQNGTPLSCNDGFACNGVESCDSVTGCDDPADVVCGSNAECQEPSGTCTCDANYQDTNGDGDCLAECPVDHCNDNGTCEYDASDVYYCNCSDGWSGDQCEVPPLPTVEIVELDCSADDGWCLGRGRIYPLIFNSTNADTFTATQTQGCPAFGSFSPTNGTVSSSPMSTDFITGDCGGWITLKVEICNITGCTFDTLDVETY